MQFHVVEFVFEGTGLACVARTDAAEAIRRLEATPASADIIDAAPEDPHAVERDEILRIVGVTSVPGGCAVTQPWGYAPKMPGVPTRLSVGTVCYGLYANPKSGNQGAIARDGAIEGWDLHPGGGPYEDDTPEEVLASYLHQYHAVAFTCAFARLRPTGPRAVVGPPDRWVRLPERDFWKH
ncbi:hypothetical protein ACIBSV_36285 [Embleya sp. NPDC050154]|uniref:hypothetical protein n=1 Tax=unclassified Embleya TaxID=2699296 RepID=UPI00378EFFB5